MTATSLPALAGIKLALPIVRSTVQSIDQYCHHGQHRNAKQTSSHHDITAASLLPLAGI